MIAEEAYVLSKSFTKKSLDGQGALKGAPCTIKSITEVDGGQKITFEWTGTSGTKQTSEMTVKNGVSVTGISDKGNGVFTLLFSDGSESDPIQCVKGEDGFSPTATVEKVGKVATITITDKNGTTTATIKDGEGSEGGEANVIDSISINGVNVPVDENKNVDITVPSTEGLASETWVNEQGFLTEHQDISGKVDKVDGKSLIADSEIERLASVDNYDDTQVKTQIQAVANGLMDSVGYSADYKTIDIIAKNGVKKSVNVAPIISHASITELSDVDTTNKATGKALVYNATTSKHEYADVSGTDEKVKMDASSDSKYLSELLDNVTIANENGELKVKKLDGQEVTITEINYLKGLTMNVMDLVNMFSNGGVKIINTPVATYAELLTLDKSSFIEGVSYLVYVLADENHDNAKTTYLVDKDSETPTYFGFADSQRDFTTNPIDLATEITGKLGIANMDSDAIKALFTVDDTYKTETATNNAFSTHGAKALYDELLLAIGNKANSSDLTAHKDDADIHVSTEDRTKWDSAKTHADSAHAPSNAQENVLEIVKVNGTALEVSDKAVNVTVPTKVSELTDSADYAKTADIPTTLPANGGNADTVNNHTVKSDVPENAVFTDTVYDDTEVQKIISDNGYGEVAGGKNLLNHNIIDSKIKNCSVLFKNDTFYATNKGNYSIFTLSVPTIVGKSYTVTIKDWSDYSYRCIASVSDLSDNTLVSMVILDATLSMTFTAVGTESLIQISPNNTPNEMSNTITFKCMLEEGSVATEYEPYFPSNKMLTEEVSAQNDSLSVIGKCKNLLNPTLQTTTKNGVTCTNNGDGTYTLNGTASDRAIFAVCGENFYALSYFVGDAKIVKQIFSEQSIPGSDGNYANGYYFAMQGKDKLSNIYIDEIVVDDYVNKTYRPIINVSKGITVDNVVFKPMLTTNLSATYDDFVPYTGDGETLTHDVAKLNDSLGTLCKCKNLLNPTLATTTVNGITCTNNGDGTITLNGTASANATFRVCQLEIQKYLGKTLRLVGCPKNGSVTTYYMFFTDNQNSNSSLNDLGEGATKIVEQWGSNEYWVCYITIVSGVTVSNLVFKPMITEDLKATYDDFVPYTGDGATLTHDVAELKNDLGGLTFSASGTTLSITDGTNTWTLEANS